MKRLILVFAAIVFSFNAATLPASQKLIQIDVWRTSDYEDYVDYENVDFFLRPRRDCYIAVLLVDPDGYANVIYPGNSTRQFKLRRGRVYRLSELLDDDPVYFVGMNGDAFISVVTSRRPIRADRWLLDEFVSFIGYEYAPAFSFEIALGRGFRLAWHNHLRHRRFGVFSVPFIVRDYYHPRRSVHYVNRGHYKRWQQRWRYRTHEPVVYRKQQIWNRDNYFVRGRVKQHENRSPRNYRKVRHDRRYDRNDKPRRRNEAEHEEKYKQKKRDEEKFARRNENRKPKIRKNSGRSRKNEVKSPYKLKGKSAKRKSVKSNI